MNDFDEFISTLKIEDAKSITKPDEVFVHFFSYDSKPPDGIRFNYVLHAEASKKGKTYEVRIPKAFDIMESFYIPYDIISATLECINGGMVSNCGLYYLEDQYTNVKEKKRIITADTSIGISDMDDNNIDRNNIQISSYFKYLPNILTPFNEYKIVFELNPNIKDLSNVYIPIMITSVIFNNAIREKIFQKFREDSLIYHFDRCPTFYMIRKGEMMYPFVV